MSRRVLYPWWTWIVWVLLMPAALIVAGVAVVATTAAHTLLFDNPQWWWLIAAGPAAGMLTLYGVSRRRRALERFTSADLAPLLVSRLSPGRQAFRAGLVVLALLMIAAAIIGPRWGVYLDQQRVRGVDVVVAVDVSRSMLADDIEPSRLERAKRDIRQQLTERAVFQGTSRLALLAFAGSVSLKLPLTTDHMAFRSKLEAVRVGDAPRGGTAIGEAIREAADLFVKSPEQATKIILLFTDGEDHEGGAVEAAKAAFEEHGIRVYPIGVGDPMRTVGVQVPAGENERGKALLYDGQIVFSKLDVPGLRRIAEAGSGQFATIQDLHRVVDVIAGMRKVELTTEERIRHTPRYQWFVAAALLLLGLETVLHERRSSVEKRPQRVWQQEAV